MRIGIFDSGLGGLLIAKAIRNKLPAYDYTYLGDTKRVPYGNRSHEAVFEFTREAIDYLFKEEDCALIIVACNTASARALREIQQDYLPKHFPDRRVLGVIIPVAEECGEAKKIGILATEGTVNSKTYPEEIKKINFKATIFAVAAPLLVPIVEGEATELASPVIKSYLAPLLAKNIDTLILGCTHYPILKNVFQKMVPKKILILSQDEIIPKKLKAYLVGHPEIEKKLSKKGTAKVLVTDETQSMDRLAQKWFGKNTKPLLVSIDGHEKKTKN